MNQTIQKEFSPQQPPDNSSTDDQINQFKMIMRMYNIVTQTCYASCVFAHSERKLTEEERDCANLCLNKVINVRNRTVLRWMEMGPNVEKNILMGIAMGNVPLPETFL